MSAFGLHFGACSVCLAVYRDGKTDVVANDLGDRVTPAVVAFTDHEASVGAAAKQGIIRNVSNTVCHVKRLVGHRMDSPVVKDYKTKSSVTVVDEGGTPAFEVNYKGKTVRYLPIDIVEMIYSKMLETAQSHGGGGSHATVLAVPTDFEDRQRTLLSSAAKKSGFKILRVISEPSAALLAFDVGQLDQTEKCKCVVYRLGGTSHEATVMEVEHGMYRTAASVADHSFGADQFTGLLQEFLAAEFKRQFRCDMRDNKRSVTKLSLAAERCKHALTTMIHAQCAVDSLFDGIDFHYNMSRARFDSLCLPLLGRCTALIDQVLAQAKCTKEDVSKLVICGGGAKTPLIKKTVAEYMGQATLLNSIPEDEIIAMGAAKQAALLVGDDHSSVDQQSRVAFKILPKAVCVKMANTKDLEVVLPQHMLAPGRRQHTVTLPPSHTQLALEIFQTDDPPLMETSQLMAKLIMQDLPPGSTIKSNFHLKREGDLHITCHEVTTDQSQSISIPCH